MLEQYIVALYA